MCSSDLLCQEAFLVIPLERRQGSRKPLEQFQWKVEDLHLERKAGWNLIYVENRLSGTIDEKSYCLCDTLDLHRVKSRSVEATRKTRFQRTKGI